jgi:hypothetical protein
MQKWEYAEVRSVISAELNLEQGGDVPADPKVEAVFRRADASGTTTQPIDSEKVTDKIAQLGMQGWEMVGMSETLSDLLGTRVYWFKRPLEA